MTEEAFEQKHQTIKENVKALCMEHPSVKSDYRKLVHYYWFYVQGLKNFIPLETLEKLTSPESITRAFRKLCEEDPSFCPPERVKSAREEEQERYRRYYGKRYYGQDD